MPIIALGLLGAGAWYGYDYWTDGRFMISTDDAYVQADMAFISPKISGYVASVNVDENQQVKAGDPLLVVDNGDYRIAVAQAEAQIATQQDARPHRRADRGGARLARAGAGTEDRRPGRRRQCGAGSSARRQLLKTHVGTQAQLDDAQTAVEQANAALVGADAQIAAAEANIGVLEAQRTETASTLASLRACQRQGRARPVLHRAARAL